jgi:hypothetical protein
MVIKDLPYNVTTKKLGHDAEKWCIKNIGPRWFAVGRKTGTWTCLWNGRYDRKSYTWHFKNEKDAFWFSLKWA